MSDAVLWRGPVPALTKIEGQEVWAVVPKVGIISYRINEGGGEWRDIGEEMSWDAEVVREMIWREELTFDALLAAAEAIELAGSPESFARAVERYRAAIEACPKRPWAYDGLGVTTTAEGGIRR